MGHRRDLPPLHLLDQASPQATPAALAWVVDHLEALGEDPRDMLRWCGGTPMQAAAASVGLDGATRLAAAGSMMLALSALRRELRRRPDKTPLHCWSLSSLRAARLLRDLWPITLHLNVLPDDRVLNYLKRRGVSVATAGVVLRRRLIERGLDPGRVTPKPLPPVETVRRRVSLGRAAVRQRWGVADTVPVVAVLSDPPAAQDAFRASMVVNLVAEATGRDLRLLVHPHQHSRPRVQTLVEGYGRPHSLLQDPDLAAPWRVLPGCDAALLLDAPAPLAARYATALDLPVVAYDRPDHRETLVEHDPARVWWVHPKERKKLSDRLEHGALAAAR